MWPTTASLFDFFDLDCAASPDCAGTNTDGGQPAGDAAELKVQVMDAEGTVLATPLDGDPCAPLLAVGGTSQPNSDGSDRRLACASVLVIAPKGWRRAL
jgi:hypothetical protein